MRQSISYVKVPYLPCAPLPFACFIDYEENCWNIRITQKCSMENIWESQPTVNNIHVVNLLVSASNITNL